MDYNIVDQRLDRYLRKYFKPYPEIKLSDIYSWIRKGMILVNNKKKKEDYRLKLWDEIKFNNIEKWEKKPKKIAEPKQQKMKSLSKKDIEKMIIFEDENWIVFDKPAWIVAHQSNKHINDLSMNDYLDRYCQLNWIGELDDTFRPSFCYRLDKDTSWILVGAKNYKALKYLNSNIKNREVDKEYKTIVEWEFPNKMLVEENVEKYYDKKFWSSRMKISENWVYSKSEFEGISCFEDNVLWKISLILAKIYTWRMHQIRVHLASKWYPILWDIIYWNPVLNRKMYKQLKINRQILHCSRYSFENLDGKIISFKSKDPDDFKKLLN